MEQGTRTCPGCRFGCRADRYQCGRGAALCAREAASPDDPSVPRAGGRASYGHTLSLDASAQIVRLVSDVALQLERRVSRTGAQIVAHKLAGHGGYMSVNLLRAHTRMRRDVLDGVLESLRAEGLVSMGEIAPCGHVAMLTEPGREREAVWRAEHDAACEDFAAPLDSDERQQLVNLLFKLKRPR